jgi:hypothetical protein
MQMGRCFSPNPVQMAAGISHGSFLRTVPVRKFSAAYPNRRPGGAPFRKRQPQAGFLQTAGLMCSTSRMRLAQPGRGAAITRLGRTPFLFSENCFAWWPRHHKTINPRPHLAPRCEPPLIPCQRAPAPAVQARPAITLTKSSGISQSCSPAPSR